MLELGPTYLARFPRDYSMALRYSVGCELGVGLRKAQDTWNGGPSGIYATLLRILICACNAIGQSLWLLRKFEDLNVDRPVPFAITTQVSRLECCNLSGLLLLLFLSTHIYFYYSFSFSIYFRTHTTHLPTYYHLWPSATQRNMNSSADAKLDLKASSSLIDLSSHGHSMLRRFDYPWKINSEESARTD